MANIVVIDDDFSIYEVIRDMLAFDGHAVSYAANGVAGQKTIRQALPDLVLCDIYMPEKDGLETIRELHAQFPQLKIIAMSGGNPRGGRMDFLSVARHFGAHNLLPKPFSMTKLRETVAAAIQQ